MFVFCFNVLSNFFKLLYSANLLKFKLSIEQYKYPLNKHINLNKYFYSFLTLDKLIVYNRILYVNFNESELKFEQRIALFIFNLIVIYCCCNNSTEKCMTLKLLSVKILLLFFDYCYYGERSRAPPFCHDRIITIIKLSPFV